jgi:hypothetical protein
MPNWLLKIVSLIPFNQGKPKVQLGVLTIVLLLILGLATQCARAEESYAQIGGGGAVIRGPSAVIDLAYVYPNAAPKDAVLEVGATFIGASTLNGNVQRNNFALRATVVEGLGPVEIGLGVAYLQNTDTYNGSNLNFNLLIGYDFKIVPLTIRLQHFSNGGTRSPNKGRDMLLLIWRFQ